MKLQASTVEEFFAAAGEREPELRQLDAIIREEMPSLKRELAEGMAWRMIGYGMMSYKTKSMKEPTVWPLIAIAPQKKYLSLYVCDTIDGKYVAEVYEDRLGKVSCGKSCIRFKRVSDLELDGLREMLHDVHERYVKGEITFGI